MKDMIQDDYKINKPITTLVNFDRIYAYDAESLLDEAYVAPWPLEMGYVELEAYDPFEATYYNTENVQLLMKDDGRVLIKSRDC